MSGYWSALGYGGALVGGRTLTVDGQDTPDKLMPAAGGATRGRCAACGAPYVVLYWARGLHGWATAVAQLLPGWRCELCKATGARP